MGIFELIKMLAHADIDYVVVGGMLAFSLRHPDVMATVLDVLVRPVVAFDALRRDATMVTIADLAVPIASIDHLIDMKTGTGRSKDQIDILELRKIQTGATP